MASALIISLAGFALLAGSAYMSYKLQWWALIPALTLVAGAVSANVFFGEQTAANLVTPVVLGTAGGLSIRKEAPLKTYLITVTLILTVIMSGNYYFLLKNRNFDLIEYSRSEVAMMLEQNKAPEDLRKNILSDFDEYKETIRDIIPFLFFLNALFLSLLTHIGLKVFTARNPGEKKTGGLENFRLNDFMILVLIAGLGIFLLVDSVNYRLIYSLGLNAMLITAVLYALQALGVIKFMIIKRGLPNYLFPLLFLIILILGIEVLVFTSVLLAGFGTLDFWADFRKLGENNELRS